MKKDKAPLLFHRTFVLKLIVLTLFFGLIVAGSLFYRNLKKEMAVIEGRVESLTKENQTLQKSLTEANDQIKNLSKNSDRNSAEINATPSLTIKINDSIKDSRDYGNSGVYNKQSITVDISLTNGTQTELNFTLSDFKLKDGNNIAYTTSGGAWPTSANKTALKGQSISPGETLSGSLEFDGVPISFSTFRFYYLDKLTTITPHDANYAWYTYPN